MPDSAGRIRKDAHAGRVDGDQQKELFVGRSHGSRSFDTGSVPDRSDGRVLRREGWMMEKLEDFVNKLQSNAEATCERATRENQAFRDGYIRGVEDLFRYIRQNKIRSREEDSTD